MVGGEVKWEDGKWYKIYPYFFKGFAGSTVLEQNPGFGFDEFSHSCPLLHFSPPKTYLVQSWPLNTNVNVLVDFFPFLFFLSFPSFFSLFFFTLYALALFFASPSRETIFYDSPRLLSRPVPAVVPFPAVWKNWDICFAHFLTPHDPS